MEEPPFLDPECHHAGEEERRWDRQSFKILDLSASVGRDESDGSVEPSQSGQSTADKPKESDRVEWRSKSKGKCENGGCDSKRD